MNKNEITIAFISVVLCIASLILGITGVFLSHNKIEPISELPTLTGVIIFSVMSCLSYGDTGLKITVISLLGLLILFVSAFLIILLVLLKKNKTLTEDKDYYKKICLGLTTYLAESIKKELE